MTSVPHASNDASQDNQGQRPPNPFPDFPPITAAEQAIIDRIDSLSGNRAQCVAAAIQMLLTTFIKAERRHELALTPTQLSIAAIAGTAGYPKAAVWRALPPIADAGLITWRHFDAVSVEVTWLMPLIEVSE